jgi:hypothetical protein
MWALGYNRQESIAGVAIRIKEGGTYAEDA